MRKEAGAEYVIIGHSERRRLFGETDETVNRKLIAAGQAALTPSACIGETAPGGHAHQKTGRCVAAVREERDANETLAVLDRQIKRGLDGLTADQIGGLVVAYEPVWAIGNGRNATPDPGREAQGRVR